MIQLPPMITRINADPARLRDYTCSAIDAQNGGHCDEAAEAFDGKGHVGNPASRNLSRAKRTAAHT
jgi:hypothetical protein